MIADLPSLMRERLGWHVITVPETVTWMGDHGMRREDFPDIVTFQSVQTRIQASHEDDAIEAATLMHDDHVIVLMDRGVPDASAYLSGDEYSRVLRANGLSEALVMGRYDAVIFLHSVACGHGSLYERQGNAMRIERDASDAVLADERTMRAYATHQNVIEIADTVTISEKTERVLDAIAKSLPRIW
jgi:predicted ATPase